MHKSFLLVALMLLQIQQLSALDPQCSQDPASTGTLLPSNECQCLENFAWNSNTQRCEANCNQNLAEGADPNDHLKCICRCPAFWD